MMSLALLKYSFGAVALDIATVYEIHILDVNFCVIVFFIGYIVVNFPAIWLLERGDGVGRGVYCAMKISSLILILASWGRYYSLRETGNFSIMMIFQAIAACTYPFI